MESEKHRQEIFEFLNQMVRSSAEMDRAQLIQTHASFVLLIGDRVFKIKKPVNFGFLDFSTLDKRKYYCEREIELNRRSCDSLYLGILPIYRTGGGLSFTAHQPEDPVVEYAVHMQRMKESGFLKNRIRHRALTDRVLRRIALRLKDLYDRTSTEKDELQEQGLPENIKKSTDENFVQLLPGINQVWNRQGLLAIQTFTDRFLDEKRGLFMNRIQEGWIRDCHGDLHLEHIYFEGKQVCIFDCIEFNERFRIGDVASDIAFLAMDLDFNHSPEAGKHFVSIMKKTLQDPGMEPILNFYKVYRAIVRAKVHSMTAADPQLAKDRVRKEIRMAERYFQLALHYSLHGSKPILFVFSGQIASGKSTLASELSGLLHIPAYMTDRIRKELAGIPPETPTPESRKSEIYSEAFSIRTYQALLERAGRRLESGQSVILDGTFRMKEAREKILRLAARHEALPLFITTYCSRDSTKKRLEERSHTPGSISDARLSELDLMEESFEPYETERRISIQTDHSREESLQILLDSLVERQLSFY